MLRHQRHDLPILVLRPRSLARPRLLRPSLRRAPELRVPSHALGGLAHVRVGVGLDLRDLGRAELFGDGRPVYVPDLFGEDLGRASDFGMEEVYYGAQLFVLGGGGGQGTPII